MTAMSSIRLALDQAEPRPKDSAAAPDKKNYAERLSRHLATLVANELRPDFPGILPDEEGRMQESRARTAKGVKKLDVNFSTIDLGLGLGVSIKTLNFVDAGSSRYTKNYTRIDNELRAEAKDYHQRQPFSVMVAVVFIPMDAALDGRGDNPSSFGQAIKVFRHRAGRRTAKDEEELFERVFVVLYTHEGDQRGEAICFDVMDAPPRSGLPKQPPAMDFEAMIREIKQTYLLRNDPPFTWAE
jgi:hypothetical protein